MCWCTRTIEANRRNRRARLKCCHGSKTRITDGYLCRRWLNSSVSRRVVNPPTLSVSQAAQQVERLAHGWPVLPLTPQVILEAVRGVRTHQLAYWDAQMWAIARLNQIPVVFSEDFNSGSTLEAVRFVNPFVPDFVLENWA